MAFRNLAWVFGLAMKPTSSGQAKRLRLRRNNVQEFRKSVTDVPVGTAASARSTQALRCFIEANAIHTLIRQRPPTPSCRGLSPYCAENSEPGRHTTESLTSSPQVRELPGSYLAVKGDFNPRPESGVEANDTGRNVSLAGIALDSSSCYRFRRA